MTQPGTPGDGIPVTDLDGLARRLRDIERRIQQVEANSLGPNGYVLGDRATIRTQDFDGTSFADPGTTGVYLASEAGVGKLIVNDILLRGGIIGNDALASPIQLAANGNGVSPVAFSTTSNTVVTSCTIAIPLGFTKAMLICYHAVAGVNPTGAADNLITRIRIVGVGTGATLPMGVAAGYSTVNFTQHNVLATGLTPGSTITINGEGWTQVAPWASSGFNTAQLGVVALFLR